MKALTTEEFIEKAKSFHNEKYNYDKTIYNGNQNKVLITCLVHGDFWQLPSNHFKYGCANCSKDKVRLTTEKFIEKAKEIHGDMYDYSETYYGNNNNCNVNIVCKIHGIFKQKARQHLSGQGCVQCKNESIGQDKKLTTEIFIDRSNKLHNKKYDYSLVEYSIIRKSVIIICPEHGKFDQIAALHLLGHGCKKCAIDKVKNTTEDMIEKFNKIHGEGTYDYSQIDYVNYTTPIKIICQKHGAWKTTPHTHLNHKCPKCTNGGVSHLSSLWLDSLNIPKDNREIWISVSNKKLKVDALVNNVVYEFWGDYWHGNPKVYDKSKINVYAGKTYGQLFAETQHRRKLIIESGYDLIEIWEADWKKLNKKRK